MKNVTIYILWFVLTFVLLPYTLFGRTYTWTGNVSTAWNQAGNWSLSGFPNGSGDDAIIVSASNQPVLDQNRTIGNLTITSGTLNLGGYSLICTATLAANGGTVQNGILKPRGNGASSQANFSGTYINCRVEANCGTIALSGSTFGGVCMLTDSSANDSNGSGGCTFNDSLTIRHVGSGKYFNLAQTTGDTYNGVVTIINASTTSIRVAYSGNNYFNKNLILSSENVGGIEFSKNGGYSELDTAKLILIGTSGFRLGNLSLAKFTQLSHTSQSLTFTDSSAVVSTPIFEQLKNRVFH